MKQTNLKWVFTFVLAILVVSLACRAGLSPAAEIQDNTGPNEDAATINVGVKEFSFSVAASQVEAGTVTFVVTNKGSMHHDFALRGNGMEWKTSMIDPGESATLTVNLTPGTYTYACTIFGHDLLGMHGTITVTSN